MLLTNNSIWDEADVKREIFLRLSSNGTGGFTH